jgi:hypothetical protein
VSPRNHTCPVKTLAQGSHRTILGVVIVVAGIGTLAGMRALHPSSTAIVSLKPQTAYVQATVLHGSLKVTLLAPSRHAGVRRILIRLSQTGHILNHRTVLIGLSRPMQRPSKIYPMHFDGSLYLADLAPPGNGLWVAYVSIGRVPARAHHVDVPFLIRLSPGHPSTILIYPLSVPVNGWNTTLSLPFHGTAAVVHATIAADGAASFRISLGRQTQHERRSIHLKLVLTMLTMNMGHLMVAARHVSPYVFTARSFFSMPGAWRIELTDGGSAATGALLIGEHS